jgi:hypothetical protein
VIVTEQLALVMTPLTLSEEVLASNLDRDTGYPKVVMGFLSFYRKTECST